MYVIIVFFPTWHHSTLQNASNICSLDKSKPTKTFKKSFINFYSSLKRKKIEITKSLSKSKLFWFEVLVVRPHLLRQTNLGLRFHEKVLFFKNFTFWILLKTTNSVLVPSRSFAFLSMFVLNHSSWLKLTLWNSAKRIYCEDSSFGWKKMFWSNDYKNFLDALWWLAVHFNKFCLVWNRVFSLWTKRWSLWNGFWFISVFETNLNNFIQLWIVFSWRDFFWTYGGF